MFSKKKTTPENEKDEITKETKKVKEEIETYFNAFRGLTDASEKRVKDGDFDKLEYKTSPKNVIVSEKSNVVYLLKYYIFSPCQDVWVIPFKDFVQWIWKSELQIDNQELDKFIPDELKHVFKVCTHSFWEMLITYPNDPIKTWLTTADPSGKYAKELGFFTDNPSLSPKFFEHAKSKFIIYAKKKEEGDKSVRFIRERLGSDQDYNSTNRNALGKKLENDLKEVDKEYFGGKPYKQYDFIKSFRQWIGSIQYIINETSDLLKKVGFLLPPQRYIEEYCDMMYRFVVRNFLFPSAMEISDQFNIENEIAGNKWMREYEGPVLIISSLDCIRPEIALSKFQIDVELELDQQSVPKKAAGFVKLSLQSDETKTKYVDLENCGVSRVKVLALYYNSIFYFMFKDRKQSGLKDVSVVLANLDNPISEFEEIYKRFLERKQRFVQYVTGESTKKKKGKEKEDENLDESDTIFGTVMRLFSTLETEITNQDSSLMCVGLGLDLPRDGATEFARSNNVFKSDMGLYNSLVSKVGEIFGGVDKYDELLMTQTDFIRDFKEIVSNYTTASNKVTWEDVVEIVDENCTLGILDNVDDFCESLHSLMLVSVYVGMNGIATDQKIRTSILFGLIQDKIKSNDLFKETFIKSESVPRLETITNFATTLLQKEEIKTKLKPEISQDQVSLSNITFETLRLIQSAFDQTKIDRSTESAHIFESTTGELFGLLKSLHIAKTKLLRLTDLKSQIIEFRDVVSKLSDKTLTSYFNKTFHFVWVHCTCLSEYINQVGTHLKISYKLLSDDDINPENKHTVFTNSHITKISKFTRDVSNVIDMIGSVIIVDPVNGSYEEQIKYWEFLNAENLGVKPHPNSHLDKERIISEFKRIIGSTDEDFQIPKNMDMINLNGINELHQKRLSRLIMYGGLSYELKPEQIYFLKSIPQDYEFDETGVTYEYKEIEEEVREVGLKIYNYNGMIEAYRSKINILNEKRKQVGASMDQLETKFSGSGKEDEIYKYIQLNEDSNELIQKLTKTRSKLLKKKVLFQKYKSDGLKEALTELRKKVEFSEKELNEKSDQIKNLQISNDLKTGAEEWIGFSQKIANWDLKIGELEKQVREGDGVNVELTKKFINTCVCSKEELVDLIQYLQFKVGEEENPKKRGGGELREGKKPKRELELEGSTSQVEIRLYLKYKYPFGSIKSEDQKRLVEVAKTRVQDRDLKLDTRRFGVAPLHSFDFEKHTYLYIGKGSDYSKFKSAYLDSVQSIVLDTVSITKQLLSYLRSFKVLKRLCLNNVTVETKDNSNLEVGDVIIESSNLSCVELFNTENIHHLELDDCFGSLHVRLPRLETLKMFYISDVKLKMETNEDVLRSVTMFNVSGEVMEEFLKENSVRDLRTLTVGGT